MKLKSPKFLFRSLFLSILLLLISPSLAMAADDQKLVRVGVYDNPPKIYRDQTGKVTGLFGDILNFIATQENWQLVFIDGTFDEGMERLAAEQIDIMVDVAISEERSALFNLSNETILGSWGVVYSTKGHEIDSFKDLDGKKIALLKSSVYHLGEGGIDAYIHAFGLNVEYILVDEYKDVYSLLESGQADVGVVSRISGLAAEVDYPNLRATNIIFSPTELRFALTKNSQNGEFLRERLDYWIKELKDGRNDVFKEILRKHKLSGLIAEVEIVPLWLYPVIAIGLVIIAGSWFLVGFLRRARKLALQNLAKTDSYLKEVIENTPVILSAINKDGIITMATGKALKAIDQKPTQLIGHSIFELYKNNQIILENAKQAFLGKSVQYNVELNNRHLVVNIIPLKNHKNEIELLSVAIDTTENSKLEKAKTGFLRLVQHQLRTPPTAIRWTSELLEPTLSKLLKGKELELWSTLKGANDRMINLANSLSLVSEVTARDFVLNIGKVDVRVLLSDILASFKKDIEKKKLKISISTEGSDQIEMDKHLLGVILQSLISNSVLYTDDQKEIKIKFTNKKNTFQIEVSDQGWGIPENEHERVFTQFYRGEDANRFNPDGLGMALHTTKAILDLVGGKISFTSKVNKGSTFTVELPKDA